MSARFTVPPDYPEMEQLESTSSKELTKKAKCDDILQPNGKQKEFAMK
jgi:hypothetical protein